jgi:hypothetical protein
LKIKIVQQFFDRNWIFIFSLYFADFVFSRQKIAKRPLLRAKKIISRNRSIWVSTNPEFDADFRSEEIIQKNVPKKLDPKNNFFWGLGRYFLEKQFFGIIFFFLDRFILNNSFRSEISIKFWIFFIYS